MSSPERGIWLEDATHREDLATFVERAVRLDDAAVIRLRERPGGLVVAWVATGFDVLASRVVAGRVRPADLSAGADALAQGLGAMDRSGHVDPGFPMDSAWRGVLPPETASRTSTTCPRGWCWTLRSAGSRWRRSTAARTVRRCRCWTRRCLRSAPNTVTSTSRCAAYSP